MPKAERLTPEKLMPRWLSPVTLRIMSEANFPISGLPLSVTDAMSSHPYPLHPLPTCQLVNLSTNVHLYGPPSLWASGPLALHHSLHPDTPARDFLDFIEGYGG